MQILAHRGYWNKNTRGNSPEALKTALENGYGIETDVRDYDGKIVISHNIASASCQNAEEVFQWVSGFQNQYCFAINIKADGLKEILSRLLKKYNILNYFLFDMSVPQMVEFNKAGLRFFTRQSELEKEPNMYEQASGVWIDGFYKTDWITEMLLQTHIKNGKIICIVSTELHQKENYKDFWKVLKEYKLDFNKVMLCTDYPDEARNFFRDKM